MVLLMGVYYEDKNINEIYTYTRITVKILYIYRSW